MTLSLEVTVDIWELYSPRVAKSEGVGLARISFRSELRRAVRNAWIAARRMRKYQLPHPVRRHRQSWHVGDVGVLGIMPWSLVA